MSGELLIIEADEEVASRIADAVSRRGLSPRLTPDGKDGYDIAQVSRPAAIVLCAELPKVSGYSICAKLKKDPELKDIPLLFTSAEASESTFEHHKKLKVRADEYLSKPFEIEELLELLGRHVALSQVGDEEDEIPISEDFSIEPAPLEAADEPEPFVDDGGFGSTDVAFEAALEAIAEQPAPMNGLDAATAAPAPEPALAAAPAPAPTPAAPPPVEAPRVRAGTSDLERNHGSSQRDVLALKRELVAKDRELFEVREQVHAKDRDILALRDQETELEGRLVQVEDERDALREQLHQLEERAAALESEQHQTRQRAEAAEQRVAAAEQRATETEQRASQLQSELESTIGRLNQTESERDQATSELEQSRGELERSRAELDAARRENEELGRSRSELEERHRQVEETAAQARSALESGLEILGRLRSE